MTSLQPAALIRNITKPVVRFGDIRGKKGPIFGARLVEAIYRPPEGWHAPVLRDYGDLELRPQIASLHYGLQVFDHCVISTDKATGKPRIFRQDDFLARLAKSRDYLHFAKYNDADLMSLIKTYVEAEENNIPTGPGQALLVRTCIIGDNNNLSAGPADAFRLFIFSSPFDAFADNKALNVKADPAVRRSWEGGTGSVSVGGNYANQIFHETEARKHGFDKIMWLVDNEVIATVGDANFFAVFKTANGLELVTPTLGQTSMAGNVRTTVLELIGKDARESKLTATEFTKALASGTAVEAFTTSSRSITQPIGAVTYQDKLYKVPTPADGFAARLKRDILSIWDGTKAHPASKLL